MTEPFQAQKQWPYRQTWFATAFRYQYCLSEQKEDIFSFAHSQNGNWHLHHGKDLPFCVLEDLKGRPIGELIGIAVAPQGLIKHGNSTIPLDSEAPGFWDSFENYIVDVAGRYAFILNCAGQQRLYTDPAGMIGAVYNKEDRYVAASLLLALKRDVIPHPLYDFDIVENHGGKISLFHTADAHVRRLNPNFYLNLTDFSEHRFWPRSENFSLTGRNRYDLYDEIIETTAFNVGEIANTHRTALPITGGQDSRILLSCMGKHLGKIDQYYTHINNYGTRRDDGIAKRLCDEIEIRHETHDFAELSIPRWEKNRTIGAFNLTFGTSSPAPLEYINGAITGVEDGSVILRGYHTDILRAVYVFKQKKAWDETSWQIRRLLITPKEKFTAAIAKKFQPTFRAWQETLPSNAREKAADFMFLEIYLNSTLGAAFPALWRNFYMSPFSSRKLISLALSFGEDERRSSSPVFDLIERANPKLSPIAFDFEFPASLDDVENSEFHYEITKDRLTQTRARQVTQKAFRT